MPLLRQLNVDVPAHLAVLAKELGFTLVSISTGYSPFFLTSLFADAQPRHPSLDYVFDGTSPPYAPSAQTNPLNLYGVTKRDGELAVLGVQGARIAVLRVPILYVLDP